MRVLVTRPEPDARATAARLAEAGHEAIVAPLMRIVADTAVALPTAGIGAVLLTSRNAVEALAARADFAALAGLPAFAVGDRTAAAARTAGFRSVVSAEGDRHALVATLAAARAPADGALLWPCGRDRTGDLVEECAAWGFAVRPVEVYRAEAIESFDAPTRAALAADTVDAVAIHSPRAAELFVAAFGRAGLSPTSSRIVVHAISAAAAAPCRAAGFSDVVVAGKPDEKALMGTFGRTDRGAAVGSGTDPRRSSMAKKPATPKPAADPAETDAAESTAPREATTETATPEAIAPEETLTTGTITTETAPVAPIAGGTSEAAAPQPVGTTPVEPASAADASAAEAETTPAEPVAGGSPSDPGRGGTTPPIPPVPERPQGDGTGAHAGTVLVGAAVAAALVGGVLGTVGGRLFAPPPPKPAATASADPRLDALAERLGTIETRLGEVDARDKDVGARLDALKPTDLSAIETRLAAIEAAPALRLPNDLADRLAAVEKAAAERAAAAKSSVASILAENPTVDAKTLAKLAERVDDAVAAAREAAAAEFSRLAAEIRATRAETEARTGDATSSLQAAFAEASRRLAAETDRRGAEAAAALDAMRQRIGGVEALKAEVDGLIGRLGGLEVSNKEAKADRERVSQTLDSTLEATEGRVASLESRLVGVESGAEAAHRAQADAVLAVALADLRSAVDAGRPFRPEFEVVRRAAPEATTALVALEPFLDRGVPSPTALREGLPDVVRAIGEADEKSGAGAAGMFDRLWSQAGRLVRVRPAGDSGGTDIGSQVSRIEARIAAGDLAGALAAWKALPETARAASAAWGAALDARVTVDAALAAQTAAVVSKLAPSRP